ncbi:MAG: oligosaccharide flippase family protein [Spirochaetes bacterium]|nr:oligosaccharide flippase family protein [Spirochaetota bacterium]
MFKTIQLNTFVKNILKIFTGAVITRIIGIASLALLARLYSPHDFGIVELALSVVGIALVFASLRYEQAIVVPSNDEDAINIYMFTLMWLCVVSGSMLVFIYIGMHFFNIPILHKMNSIAYAIPLLLLFRGIKEYTAYWFIRKKRFARSAFADVITRLFEVSLKILLYGLSAWGLMLGNIGGFLAGCVVLYFFIFRMDTTVFHAISLARIKKNVKEYKNFPFYQFPSQLFKIFTDRIPTLMFAPLFGFTVVGFYSLGYKLINEPMSILGQSIGSVYYQEASYRYAKNEPLQTLIEEVFEKLVVVSLVPILFLFFKGESLFSLFLGKNWRIAGFYTELIAPMLFFRFIAIPLGYTLNVIGKQKLEMMFNFFILVFSILSIVVGAYVDSVTCALMILSLSNSLLYTVMIAAIMIVCGISLQKVMRRIKFYIIVSFPIVAGFILLRRVNMSDIESTVIGLFLCALYYLIIVLYYIKTGKISSFISFR